MDRKIFIYSLSDPTTKEVRYIGKTNNVKRRYNEHLIGKKIPLNNHKDNWIRTLTSKNLKPILNVIEEVTNEDWGEREIYWISQYDNLVNSTMGGEDGRMTDDVKEKLRILNTGTNNPMWGKKWTEEQRRKLSEQRRNTPKTDSFKIKVSEKLGSKCVINGIEYRSIRQAQKELKLSFKKIKELIKET